MLKLVSFAIFKLQDAIVINYEAFCKSFFKKLKNKLAINFKLNKLGT